MEGTDTWIEFEFPHVYFISHIILWNFMSWYDTKEDDSYSALVAFDVSYSLDGEHWFYMGRVTDLPRIPTTGIPQYAGECIQNRCLGGADAMPQAHRKASLVQLEVPIPRGPTPYTLQWWRAHVLHCIHATSSCSPLFLCGSASGGGDACLCGESLSLHSGFYRRGCGGRLSFLGSMRA